MEYAATLSEYQILIIWKLMIKYFDFNINHNYVVENIVDMMLRTLEYAKNTSMGLLL